jgi:hypothetical protein
VTFDTFVLNKACQQFLFSLILVARSIQEVNKIDLKVKRTTKLWKKIFDFLLLNNIKINMGSLNCCFFCAFALWKLLNWEGKKFVSIIFLYIIHITSTVCFCFMIWGYRWTLCSFLSSFRNWICCQTRHSPIWAPRNAPFKNKRVHTFQVH